MKTGTAKAPHALRRLAAHARVQAPWRRALPHRGVYREVQGARLYLPWSHRLPDYVALYPDYGRNLVDLAAALAADSPAPLQVVDVGANVGDSTKQIVERTGASVLAVEGDPYYLSYLRRNVADHTGVAVAYAMLATSSGSQQDWAPARRGGTTQFRVLADAASPPTSAQALAAPATTVQQLLAAHPEFDHVRLVKSDTDGHDTTLVPELAAAFSASRPVLFFEFDPALTRQVSAHEPDEVWDALGRLGYDRVGLWSNTGATLGTTTCGMAATATSRLLTDPRLGVDYLDVAVVHGDDVAGGRALGHVIGAAGGTDTGAAT